MLLYNPFILKRENLLEKDAFNQDFDTSLLDEARHLEETLGILKTKLIDVFHDILAQSSDHTLLDAIRFLRNHKYKQFVERIDRLQIDSNDIHENMNDFRNAFTRYNEVMEKARENFLADCRKVRRRYQELLSGNPFLAQGMMMINPKVYYKLRSYLDTPVDEHRSKHRKLEGTLHNFIHRAAYKTSPFSNITNVGWVEFGDEKYASRAHHKSVALNFTFVYHLISYYTGQSTYFKENITYTIPPFSISTQDGAHYIEFLAKNDQSRRLKVFLSDERLGKLKIPGALVKLFNVKPFITFNDLHHALGTAIDKNKVHRLIDNYTKIGLLVPAIGFDERSCDHFLEDIKQKLPRLMEGDHYREMIGFIDTCYRLAIRISSAENMDDMHILFAQLADVLRKVREKTGITFLPNQIFYEDGYFIDKETTEDVSMMDVEEPLKKIQLFSLIFDNSIRLRLEFAERIRQITDDHHSLKMESDFFAVLFDVSKAMIHYWTDPTYVAGDTFQSEVLKELDKLKSAFLSDFEDACDSAEGYSIDIKALIDTYVAKIPDELKAGSDLASSIFAQVNGDHLIINSVYEGQEKYLARFMNIFHEHLENSERYQSFIETFYDRNNYYDLTDTYGFNGNVKQHRLKRECYTSGIGTRRFVQGKDDTLVRLEDFTINTESNQMKFIDPFGNEAKVCFRGSLTPVYMPGYIATVLQMFTSGAMYFNVSELISRETIPRITYDHIILSRRRIRLSVIGEEVKKKTGEDDFMYYRRMNDVFSHMALPKIFFIVLDQSIQYDDEDMYRFKPLFINMDNPLSVKMFEKEVAHRFAVSDYGLLFMEEYLSNDGPYVKEYNFEIYQAHTAPLPAETN